MKRRDRQQPAPPSTPEQVIAAAKGAFQAAVPGVGVCDKCGQATDSRTHRKRCEG